MVKVSVVGLSYNCSEMVLELIKSFYESSLKDIEMIIIDNASSDGTVEKIHDKYPKVKVIARHENIGSAAFNDALPIAKGEYIFYVDGDVKLGKNCLKEFYETAESLGKNSILTPNVFGYDEIHPILYQINCCSVISRSFYSAWVKPKDMFAVEPKEVMMTSFCFMHKDAIKELGYIFDKDYFLYAEDVDLCLRMRLQGFKLYYCPNAIIYNKSESETAKKHLGMKKIVYYMERNLLMTFFKICSTKNLWLFLPYVLIMRGLALIKDLVTLKLSIFLARLKAYFWVIFHMPMIMQKRSFIQSKRKKDDKHIFSLTDELYFLKSQIGR